MGRRSGCIMITVPQPITANAVNDGVGTPGQMPVDGSRPTQTLVFGLGRGRGRVMTKTGTVIGDIYDAARQAGFTWQAISSAA